MYILILVKSNYERNTKNNYISEHCSKGFSQIRVLSISKIKSEYVDRQRYKIFKEASRGLKLYIFKNVQKSENTKNNDKVDIQVINNERT